MTTTKVNETSAGFGTGEVKSGDEGKNGKTSAMAEFRLDDVHFDYDDEPSGRASRKCSQETPSS